MFSFFFFFYMLFYSVVESGGSFAFEFDLSHTGALGFSLLFFVDWASVMFSLSVLFISGSVLVYCCFYMRGEVYPERFCWLVVLFVVSMNLFIYMPSLMGLMLGWDGLGVVSFALVSYYKNGESLGAGNITVLTGRIGDACLVLLVACCTSNLSWHWFDLQYQSLFWVSGCLIIASMTKSAQVPFSAWLPAAMAAPTPVSALVHSSTLVTAGVYVLFRYYTSVQGSWVISLVILSMFTMAFSGVVACVERDLKKVVAFSTMSQLGVMVLAVVGAGFKEAGMFHLLVHAYYKSLMFLCVGYVIFKGGGVQDSRFYSGLWTKMPSVAAWLIVACLCLSSVPFTSGFYSKHCVLEGCFFGDMSTAGSVLICFSVFFTAFYSFRLLSLMFFSCSSEVCCSPVEWSTFVDFSNLDLGKVQSKLSVCYWSLLAPLCFLGGAALFVGLYLLKCFVFLNSYFYCPSCLKIVMLVMNVLGCWFGFVNKYHFPNTYGLYLSSPSAGVSALAISSLEKVKPCVNFLRFSGNNWHLPELSGNNVACVSLVAGGSVNRTIEKGWVEEWLWSRQTGVIVKIGKLIYAFMHHTKVSPLLFVLMGMWAVLSVLW
uniref:NADH dehydrogenase subunit 5 n=1 Tax=Teredothyra matocotana TaxID=2795841 RepID=UPI002029042A|nr:NADH dehydrogenase subunit 5 [Teredothyra matocotana]UPX89339.1 NADH dehydrogenase subunit 5 [Teredothyra matocotana]